MSSASIELTRGRAGRLRALARGRASSSCRCGSTGREHASRAWAYERTGREALLPRLPRPRRAALPRRRRWEGRSGEGEGPARLRSRRHRRRAADRAGARSACRYAGAASATRRADLDGNFLVVAATPVPVGQPRGSSATPRRGRCSSTSSTRPSSAASSSPPSTGATRSRSRSRPAARRPRSPSGCATSSALGSARSTSPSRGGCASCGPGRSGTTATYGDRRDYFEALVEESLLVTVYLVGAGPGDPGLITRARARARADLRRPRPRPAGRATSSSTRHRDDAIRIGRERLDQDEINRLLVLLRPPRPRRRPPEGRRPVRLRPRRRGGTRAGRGGRPVRGRPRRLVAERGPGRRGDPGHAPRRLVAGDDRERPGTRSTSRALARAGARSSCSWGCARLTEIADGLVEHGLDPDTPAAVISAGTTPEQEVAVAPLASDRRGGRRPAARRR